MRTTLRLAALASICAAAIGFQAPDAQAAGPFVAHQQDGYGMMGEWHDAPTLPDAMIKLNPTVTPAPHYKGTVYLPAGELVLTSEQLPIKLYTNQALRGAHRTGTIIKTTNTDKPMIEIEGENVTIENIVLERINPSQGSATNWSSVTSSAVGIDIKGHDSVIIRDTQLIVHYDGVTSSGSNDGANLTLEGVYINKVRRSFLRLDQASKYTGISLLKCLFQKSGQTGVVIQGPSSGVDGTLLSAVNIEWCGATSASDDLSRRGIHYKGNNFRMTDGNVGMTGYLALDLEGVKHARLNSAYFHTTGVAIDMPSTIDGEWTAQTTSGRLDRDYTASGVRLTSDGSNVACEDFAMTGCTISNTSMHGIIVSNAKNVVLQGCSVHTNGQTTSSSGPGASGSSSYRILDAYRNVRILGSRSYTDTGLSSYGQRYGINVTGNTGDYLLISGNDLKDSGQTSSVTIQTNPTNFIHSTSDNFE